MSHKSSGPELLALSNESASALVRQLLDGAPDAMVVIDGQGRIVLFNLLAERLFGYTRGEVLGRPIEQLVPARLRETHQRHRALYTRAPSMRPMDTGRELHGVRKDGTEFSVEISLSPILSEGEQLTCASVRDISERKQREQQVKRLQEHLLNAIESIPGAFAIFDHDDRLVLCNSSYRLLFGDVGPGHTLEGILGSDIIRLSAEAGLFELTEGQTSESFVRSWLDSRQTAEWSLEVATVDGRRLRITERATAGKGRLTTIWDVTDEAKHAHQLLRARTEAEAASHAKSEFLASMSHELRTPLNSILGFAQLLLRDRQAPLSERQQQRVGHVLSSGEHLLHLIDDVLDLARVESGHVCVSLEAVGLEAIVSEVKTTLDPMAARSGISVSVDPELSAPDVVADRTRLKQILLNFGSNAIKYGRHGGQVVISTHMLPTTVRVQMQDDGVGIAEAQQNKIFQPFQRAGQEAGPIEGTGIGLALSKRLAELMHANLGFTSQQGSGSTFWIELTLASAHSAPTTRSEGAGANLAQLRSEQGPRFRVVYVEDNPSNIAFMEDFFADYDRLDLVTARSAEEGLPLIRACKPDVVIMDLNLPGMNGMDATRMLSQWSETRNIPVIALTAATMLRDSERMRNAGFCRFLTKPVQLDKLARTLDELLATAAADA